MWNEKWGKEFSVELGSEEPKERKPLNVIESEGLYMANDKDKSSSPGIGTVLLLGIVAIVLYVVVLAIAIALYAAAGAAVGALIGFLTGGPPGAAAGAALGAAIGAGVGASVLIVNGIIKGFAKKNEQVPAQQEGDRGEVDRYIELSHEQTPGPHAQRLSTSEIDGANMDTNREKAILNSARKDASKLQKSSDQLEKDVEALGQRAREFDRRPPSSPKSGGKGRRGST
jgi:hypothetical protein